VNSQPRVLITRTLQFLISSQAVERPDSDSGHCAAFLPRLLSILVLGWTLSLLPVGKIAQGAALRRLGTLGFSLSSWCAWIAGSQSSTFQRGNASD
jgi:hypothetical protein